MKFNKCYDNGTFDEYLIYLNSIQEKLPAQLYQFISNPDRHNFSEGSLHDSTIKKINFESDPDNNNCQLELVLLGNQQDREFRLLFISVTDYHVQQNTSEINADLITFEIGISEELGDDEQVLLVFRAAFAGQDGLVQISAKQIEFSEVVYQ